MIDREPRTIVCGPGDKLRWLEAIAADPRCAAFDVRLAVAISNRIDKFTGTATIGQLWLAGYIAADERSVRRSAGRLERHGHVSIERSRGRGHAHVYRPSIKPGNSVRVYHHENRTLVALKPDSGGSKTGHQSPPLPNNYQNSSLDDGTNCEPGELRWLAVKRRLASTLGPQIVSSWLANLKVEMLTTDSVVLAAPNRFIRDRCDNQFGDAVAAEWRRELPTIERVKFVHHVQRAAE